MHYTSLVYKNQIIDIFNLLSNNNYYNNIKRLKKNEKYDNIQIKKGERKNEVRVKFLA